MNIIEVAKDAKKALGALATVEAAAVAVGAINSVDEGYVTAVLGAVTSIVVYVLGNTPPPPYAARHQTAGPGALATAPLVTGTLAPPQTPVEVEPALLPTPAGMPRQGGQGAVESVAEPAPAPAPTPAGVAAPAGLSFGVA